METDHLILLLARFRGSLKLSQPRFRCCVVVVGDVVRMSVRTIDVSTRIRFMLFAFLKWLSSNQRTAAVSDQSSESCSDRLEMHLGFATRVGGVLRRYLAFKSAQFR
jgi:hypothetical protein